ncbi:MAG TPA: molybdopterin-dependent oxidoreductase [Chloroflexia bacterium]|nr:molybdopterin-dependent oxidoreductase [Chloroflexia bacterium]
MNDAAQGFPLWIRMAHWVNFLLIGFVIRAGIQILAAYPRLYWNDHCIPGTEWAKFTKKVIHPERPWIAREQEEDWSPLIAQPGNSLGLGRHWHFAALGFWVLNGLIYVVLLFATGGWTRLIPTSWSVIPEAWDTLVGYVSFRVPPPDAFQPFDPLQQLAYAGVIFILAPFLILTGAAQSPAVEAQFPWYARLFGGRQTARSLHFIGLVAFLVFIAIHVTLVVLTGFGNNMGNIVLGQHDHDQGLAIAIGLGIIAAGIVIWGITTWYSRKSPRTVQHILGWIIRPGLRLLSLRMRSRQTYRPDEISPTLILNGYPPETAQYQQLVDSEYKDWALEVKGLVDKPLHLTLADLQAMTKHTQITKHHCIQGWTGTAQWGGVALSDILNRCHPKAGARYMMFVSIGLDARGRPFHESLPIEMARLPQTILAYEMNYEPLSVPHGAPLRLRVETQVGFKMVKWLQSIDFIESYAHYGEGQGGSREDIQNFEPVVSV